MNIFLESGLQFTFPVDWIVRQFDRTVAYRSLSGHGLKGVDFICLTPGGELWLIEVKNYRNRSGGHRVVRRKPRELADHVGRKFQDSRRLISIVNRAMRKKWYIRTLLWWYTWHPRPRPKSTYWLWKAAEDRLATPGKLRYLLWMETPEWTPDYERATRSYLLEWIEAGNRLLIAERQFTTDVPIGVTLS